MESILLKEQMQELLLSIYLMQEIQVSDTLWVLKQENSDVMIPSPEYGNPLDNMEVANVRYSKVAHIRGFFSSYLRFFCPQYIGSF